MGAIKGGKKWEGVVINNFDVDGVAKAGDVIWETERYYMGILNSIPSTGVELKKELSLQPTIKERDNYIINANGFSKYFVVAIPQGKTLLNIKSSNNENLYSHLEPEENNNFKLSTEIESIPKDGIDRLYKVYVMKTAIAFSPNIKLSIKIL